VCYVCAFVTCPCTQEQQLYYKEVTEACVGSDETRRSVSKLPALLYQIIAEFTIRNTVATLLQNDCEQIDIKTKESYCFDCFCTKMHKKLTPKLKVAETDKNLFMPHHFNHGINHL